MKSVLFVSHGSRFPQANEEAQSFAEELKQRSGVPIFEHAFLDIAPPSIPEGIDACIQKGATEIVILLNFLNTGRHVDEDIPYIVDEARAKYSGVTFHITKPVGQHDQIVDLFLDMIENGGPVNRRWDPLGVLFRGIVSRKK